MANVLDVIYSTIDRQRWIDATNGNGSVTLGSLVHAHRPDVVTLVARNELSKDVFVSTTRKTHDTTNYFELIKICRLLGDGTELDRHGSVPSKRDLVVVCLAANGANSSGVG